MAKYLDTGGLNHLSELIRQALAGKQDAVAAITMEQVNAAIAAAVLDSWEGSY